MPEYLCKGTLELHGVTFTITADNLDQAKEKAKNGQWDEEDSSGAETWNSKLDVSTLELNE